MNFISTLFSSASTAISGFSIGTWIKIGLVVVVAAAVGGLYWYGQHEAGQVTTLTKAVGAQEQIIADDKANIGALTTANQNWAKAFAQYQKDAASQQSAYQSALALKEKINEELARVEKLLASNPVAAAAALNALDHRVVCLLDSASGGAGDGCAVAASGASGAPATRTP